jgi:hypothetical protein
MPPKRRIKQTKSAGKQSSIARWGENGTNDDETDDNESLNQDEEASINNNDTADASINNEEDDNNMDIADSDDGSYLKEHIQCTQSTSSSAAKPKPLSKTQRYNRNQRIKKAEVQVDNEQFDAAL